MRIRPSVCPTRRCVNYNFFFKFNCISDFVLSAVGKPVFNRDSQSIPIGCWMRDPAPGTGQSLGQMYRATSLVVPISQ